MSELRAIWLLARRDLRLALRNWSDLLQPLIFFLAVVALFPLATSPAPARLAILAPGVVWVAALLASMLGQAAWFATDHHDGALEQFAISPQPLWCLILGKFAALWLLTGLPLVALAPLAGYALHLPSGAGVTLLLALLLGTPTVALLVAMGAALTVGLNQAGLLLSILVLPLVVPVLIFGARATQLAAEGLSAAAPLYWLGALLVLAVTMLPFATAAAVRISLE